MDKLEKAKEIIKSNFNDYRSFIGMSGGLFNTPNWVGDEMERLYDDDGLTVLASWSFGYFEVFGLSKSEFEELTVYYNNLCAHKEDK